jgi:hypothetical protein
MVGKFPMRQTSALSYCGAARNHKTVVSDQLPAAKDKAFAN